MQQFVVPQFIDVEDKILGPITIRQFLIMLVGSLVCFLAFRYADYTLFIFTLIIVGGGALVAAFVKINGQTFHYFLLNIIGTLRKPGLRLWRKYATDEELKYSLSQQGIHEEVEVQVHKVVKRARIRDLSLLVNTGGYYKPDEF